VTVHTPTGLTLTILAQPTKTPGLYVTPQIGDNRDSTPGLTGYWEVTHGPSGLALPVDGRRSCLDIHTAVRVADALADTGVDWTADREQLIELLKGGDLIVKVRDAIKRGKYPPTDGRWDGDGDKPVSPGDYPNTAEQAGASQMASAYTASALQRYADTWELIKYDRDDEDGRRLYVQNLVATLAEYGIVHLLRAFAAADPDAADAAARDLWEAHQAGDSHGEWLFEWGREYGVKTPVQGDAANAGATLPEQLSYERVMATSLAYPDHGTVGTLRQELGRYAALHNKKFSAICDQMRQREPGHKATPEENNEFYRAHSGAMAGWGLVAVLGWLAKEFPQIAIRAARMVDDVGTNGGNGYCEDINLGDGEEPEPAPPTDTADQITH
jgi:hypothetical protein